MQWSFIIFFSIRHTNVFEQGRLHVCIRNGRAMGVVLSSGGSFARYFREALKMPHEGPCNHVNRILKIPVHKTAVGKYVI